MKLDSGQTELEWTITLSVLAQLYSFQMFLVKRKTLTFGLITKYA